MKYISYFLGFFLICGYLPMHYAWVNEDQIRWAVAWVCTGILLWSPREPLQWSWEGVWLLLWACVSIAWTLVLPDAIFELLQWFLLLGCFVAGSFSKQVFEGAVWGIAVNSILAICQYYGWHPVMEVSSPAGLFGNRDELAETAFLIAIPLFFQKRWKELLLTLPALFLPQSRAVLLAGFVILLTKRYWITCIAIGVVAILFTAQKGLDVESIRIQLWKETISGLSLFGHGIGSFYSDVLAFSSIHTWRANHAHSDWLEIGFELGVPGVALASLLAWRLRGCEVFLAFCVMAWVSFCLHNPATAVLGFFAAGDFYRRSCVVREPKSLPVLGVGERSPRARLA
jgi:hypothetical protein